MNSADGSMPTRLEPTASRSAAATQLSQRWLHGPLVALDHRPQANRHPVPVVDHVLLCDRRRWRPRGATRPDDAPRRPGANRDVQQAVHGPRRDDGVFLSDSVDSQRAGQFPRAADDRRPRSGLSAAESFELVHLHARGIVHALCPAGRRRRYGLDLLHSLQQHVQQHLRDGHGRGDFHHRLFVDPHRASTSSSQFTRCEHPG